MTDAPPRTRLAFALAFLAVLAVHVLGLFVDVMDVDAAEYAHIAREMAERDGWLVVTNRLDDYLDKPPLAFWLAALSFKTFGVGSAAYKLPSLLFAVLGAVATAGLARRAGGSGALAALLFASAQGLFLMTNDCRTDTLLTGSVALASWQLVELARTGRPRHLVPAFGGIALAMLAKGPIGAFVPLFALAGDRLLGPPRKGIPLRFWLAGALLVCAALAPMCWGLWRQWGAHGLRFYFWTQSFGRLTGESSWADATTPFYFVHTFLWVVLPWSVAFAAGLGLGLASAARRLREPATAVALGGFVPAFVALSLSRYKLPHYVFPLLPFAAVLAARYLERLAEGRAGAVERRVVAVLQGLVCLAALGLAAFLAARVFPTGSVPLWLALAAALAGAAALALRAPPAARLAGPPLLSILALNLVLAAHFYPSLLRFQSGSQTAFAAARLGVPPERLFSWRQTAYSWDFHVPVWRLPLRDPGQLLARLAEGPLWLSTDAAGLAEIRALDLAVEIVADLPDFPVSRLNGRFLSPATREGALARHYLLRVARR